MVVKKKDDAINSVQVFIKEKDNRDLEFQEILDKLNKINITDDNKNNQTVMEDYGKYKELVNQFILACNESNEEVLLLLEETVAKAIAILSLKDSSYTNKILAILEQDNIEKLTLPEPIAKGEKRKPGEKGYYEKWADRENKDEKPIDFLNRVWGKYIEAGLLYQTDLRGEQIGDNPKKGLDNTLFNILHKHCKNNGLSLKDYIQNKSDLVNKRVKILSEMTPGKDIKNIAVCYK